MTSAPASSDTPLTVRYWIRSEPYVTFDCNLLQVPGFTVFSSAFFYRFVLYVYTTIINKKKPKLTESLVVLYYYATAAHGIFFVSYSSALALTIFCTKLNTVAWILVFFSGAFKHQHYHRSYIV